MKEKTLIKLIKEYYPYAKKRLGFNKDVKVRLDTKDKNNAKNPFGKTAYYNPDLMTITLFTVDRHPKDVMRSFSHELVHHCQNCEGKLVDTLNIGQDGYAQKDPMLRELEREAYEQGNLIFRDYEDNKKTALKEKKNMKDVFRTRNVMINESLMKKWGLQKEQTLTEENEMVNIPKELAEDLLGWHSGQGDPIYEIGKLSYKGQPVSFEMVQEAQAELQSLRGKVDDPRAAQELEEIIANLNEVIDQINK